MKILVLTVFILLPTFLLAGLARSVYRRGAFTEIASWWRSTSGLILESDKVLFEPDGNCRKRITCGSDNSFTFSFYGDTPSTEMNDATIALKTLSGETLVSTNLTVLWVEISMRCGQGERQSPDNGMMAILPPGILGACQMITNVILPNSIYYIPDVMGNVAEFIGKVHPSSFTDMLSLKRSFISQQTCTLYSNGFIITNVYNPDIEWPGDTSPSDPQPACFRDDDPSPYGYIYDVDTPGIRIDTQATGAQILPGTIICTRDIFAEYAMYGDLRCSDNLLWFNSGAFIKTAPVGHFKFDFFSEGNAEVNNAIGSRHTE